MHIGIVAVGTRGDVQPCVVLGLGLQRAGYEVTLVAGSNDADWIQGYGLGYADVGVDIQRVMTSETGRAWVDSNRFAQIKHMRDTFLSVADVVVGALVEKLPVFDVLITGLTMLPMTLPIAQHHNQPMINLAFVPSYPTRSASASMIPVWVHGNSPLNLITRPAMLRVMWYTGAQGVAMACEAMGVVQTTYGDFADTWLATPTLIAASPQVVPPPPDFPDHVQVTGYLFLDSPDDYAPPPDLIAFLEDGPPPVYIGFGSMTGRNDPEMRNLIVAALGGQRAVVAQGWGALGTDGLPPNVFPLAATPHDWLFPQMGAVVHHGGAGTTAAGLRAGVPSVIVPHIADQPYYGRRVHELGVGPGPIPRQKLTAANLRAAIDTALGDETMHTTATNLGETIRSEDGVGNAVRQVEEFLGERAKPA